MRTKGTSRRFESLSLRPYVTDSGTARMSRSRIKGKVSSSADAIGNRNMPRSSVSSRSAVSCDGVDMSNIWSFIDGYFPPKRKMVRGRISETAARPNPMRRVPAQPLLASVAVVSAACDSFRSLCAYGKRTRPVSVSATRRRVRANSGPPTFASSLRICLLSAGCDMQSCSADLRKCNSRAKTLKDFSSYRLSSMLRCYHCLKNDSLDETNGGSENTQRRAGNCRKYRGTVIPKRRRLRR